MDVDIFLSLILSYFCLFVPAFKPCQGKLENMKKVNSCHDKIHKKFQNPNRYWNLRDTFPLGST